MEYQEIMIGLAELPNQVADAENAVVSLKTEKRNAETTLEMRRNDVLSARSAKDWGANDGERKINQAKALQSDKEAMRLTSYIAGLDYDIAQADIDLKRAQNTFYAFRSMAELHAAWLLAGRSVASANNGTYMASAEDLGI